MSFGSSYKSYISSVSKTKLYLNSGLQPDMDPDPCAKQELDPDPCKDYRDLQEGRPPVCVAWIHASQQNRCLGFSCQLNINQKFFFRIIFKKELFVVNVRRGFSEGGGCPLFVAGSAGVIASARNF